MFNEIPSRRITDRRKDLLWAVYALLSVLGGTLQVRHDGRLDWHVVFWIVVLIGSLVGYWRKRHDDPWDPPANSSEPGKGTSSTRAD